MPRAQAEMPKPANSEQQVIFWSIQLTHSAIFEPEAAVYGQRGSLGAMREERERERERGEFHISFSAIRLTSHLISARPGQLTQSADPTNQLTSQTFILETVRC